MILAVPGADSSLPPTLRWVGPGRTAFAGTAGSAAPGLLADLSGWEGKEAVFGPGGDPVFLRALAAYFAAGGGPCVVLNLPPLVDLPPERRAAAWIGEDGGPGYRTGILSLLDREDVGTLAVPGLSDRELRSALVFALEPFEDRFLILDALQGGGREELPPSDRAAVVGAPPGGTQGDAPPPSGEALARLEESDFSEERPQPALRALGRRGIPTLGSRYSSVEAFRLRAGLRRSIDRGTRWAVFEVHGDLLWRRLERELKAFLLRLHRLGALSGRTPEDSFQVRVSPGPHPVERLSEGLLILEVEARLRGEEASHLRVSRAGPGRGEENRQ